MNANARPIAPYARCKRCSEFNCHGHNCADQSDAFCAGRRKFVAGWDYLTVVAPEERRGFEFQYARTEA